MSQTKQRNLSVSIVICTFNRARILSECLRDLLEKLGNYGFIKTIIVDNNSCDGTKKIVESISQKRKNLRYIFEPKAGLSYARNRGFLYAKTDWIIYLDDDAKIRNDYIERLFFIIENYQFDCFGGMYYAWFPFGRPRWLPKDFGNKELLRLKVGEIDGSTGWLSGGNMVVNKKALEDIGGFNTNIGMKGNSIGYGEETLLQKNLLRKGYKIGFDPKLIIDHAVLPHKLKLSWHLKNSLARGKYNQRMSNQGSTKRMFYFLIKSSLGAIFKHLPNSLFRFSTEKEYYLQNVVLDVCIPPLWYAGVLIEKFNYNKTS